VLLIHKAPETIFPAVGFPELRPIIGVPLAKSRGTPLNRFIDEVTTHMLVEFDMETRLRVRAERGSGKAARAGVAENACRPEMMPRLF